MIYHLFHWLTGGKPYAYASPAFRATAAFILAFAIVWCFAPRVIRALVRLKVGDRPEFDHARLNDLMKDKVNTPTMGGVLVVAAVVISGLLLADLRNFYTIMGLFCTVWLAALGFVDDWLKLTAHRRSGTRDGLRRWEKLVFQFALGMLLAVFILRTGETNLVVARWVDVEATPSPYYNVLSIPFYKHGITLPTWAFVLITVVVIAGTSNAVNLTDGMDGLAAGCVAMTAVAFTVLAYVVGTASLAAYLLFYHINGAAELAVLCGAVAGASMGFLWYNAHPAQVFMGDTGALPLGGLIGYVAIVTRLELMLLIVGGVFVLEALSVMLQVASYKLTGRRVLLCAPLHHHFHLAGWTETQTVVRFWLLAALFAAFGLVTMKLR